MSESGALPDEDCLDPDIQRFVRLVTRVGEICRSFRKQVTPGEEMKMTEKLTLRILIQEARAVYAQIAFHDTLDEPTISLLDSLIKTLDYEESRLRIAFDERTLKYEIEERPMELPWPKEDGDDEDDNDFNEPEDEHENGAVYAFLKAYKRARKAYFQSVFELDPGQDMRVEVMKSLMKRFIEAQGLYEKIPAKIRSELRTRSTAGEAYHEIEQYLECIQDFFDQFMENEVFE